MCDMLSHENVALNKCGNEYDCIDGRHHWLEIKIKGTKKGKLESLSEGAELRSYRRKYEEMKLDAEV